MKSNETFTFINHQRLAEIVENADKRIVYAAPGIAAIVARAMVGFAERCEKSRLRVILDTNPEAIRLGFGEFEGIKTLIDAGIEIRKATNLRIAVVLADDHAWVFSPTSEFIFNQPTYGVSNALAVNQSFALEVLQAMAPDVAVTEDILEEPVLSDSKEAEIGRQSVSMEEIKKIDSSLKENPPQRFDAARRVRVYQGLISFIEITLEGYRIATHTLKIPTTLLGISQDRVVSERINATYRLIDRDSQLSGGAAEIERKLQEIRRDFTASLGKKYGVVILRRNIPLFEKAIQELRSDLSAFSKKVEQMLDAEISATLDRLVALFVPLVLENPPKALQYQSIGDLDEKTARRFVVYELGQVLPNAKSLVNRMRLDYYFKDVTFSSLNDPEFKRAVEEKFRLINFSKLYDEEETLGQKTT